MGDLVFGVARDVTERLAIEAEMAAAKAAAEDANRAKSEFLANMSHEIRTPLNGVIGIAAALGRTELTCDQGEMVGLIESSGVTLERLVSDVLDFSKIEAGRLDIETRVFDLRAELDDLLELFRRRALDKGLRFPIERSAAAHGEFLGDSVRLKQVLANLLSNAVKFTERGEVGVSIDVAEAPPGLPCMLTLEVRDTGVGFDAAFARDLFQRFSQADGTITRRFGGTGLGLSITRALVEMMGGEIHAESQPGRGSLFRAILPMPRRPAQDLVGAGHAVPMAPAVVDADTASHLAGLRVLLADDHPVNRRVVELILAPFGVELIPVETGAEAVEAFSRDAFDIVLMDMQMPVMDGLAATRTIRRREAVAPVWSRTPIVMLSANSMQQHRDDALAAGADLHIAKPVTVDSLTAALIEVLDSAEAPPRRALAAGRH